MKLCTFSYQGSTQAGVLRGGNILPVSEVNAKAGTKLPQELLALIQQDDIEELRSASEGIAASVPLAEVQLRLPYPVPPKIWCIGLN
jgi:hypothetical protein